MSKSSVSINPRFIPVLLVRGTGVVKTRNFQNARYLGDAVNTAAIFSEKAVDEILVFDIDATRQRRGPSFPLLRNIATECFMPLAYGGGVTSLRDVEGALSAGAEKVLITSAFATDPGLVSEAAKRFGSQSIAVGLDYRVGRNHRAELYSHAGDRALGVDPVEGARRAVNAGAGEVLLQSIDRDGAMGGYDLAVLRAVTRAVTVSVVALGGAGQLRHLAEAIHKGGASAAAAGSMFVFFGRLHAVLINVPSERERLAALRSVAAVAHSDE